MNDPYKWLTDFLAVRERTSPLSLRFIVPGVFERYFLLHHNYGIINEFPFEEYPVDKSHTENLNKRHEIEQRHDLFLRDHRHRESLYSPISLKELGERFHTGYSVDMIHNIKNTPGISSLDERTLGNIERFIKVALNQDPLHLHIDDYYRFHFGKLDEEDKQTKEKSEVLDVHDYIDFQKKSCFDSCSYLFQKDHPWCLATFEDFQHLILGCDNETAERLALVDGLEYFETTIDYRLLYGVFKDL